MSVCLDLYTYAIFYKFRSASKFPRMIFVEGCSAPSAFSLIASDRS